MRKIRQQKYFEAINSGKNTDVFKNLKTLCLSGLYWRKVTWCQ